MVLAVVEAPWLRGREIASDSGNREVVDIGVAQDSGDYFARLLGYLWRGSYGLPLTGDVPEAEVLAVLAGNAPTGQLIRRLAPVLGIQAADLFVIAGLPVPEDLCPLDARAGRMVPVLAGNAKRLSPNDRKGLLGYLKSMPQADPRGSLSWPERLEHYPDGFGALLVRMLENRNLNRVSSAQMLHGLSGLPFSGSTVARIGYGRKEVTPHILAGFSAVLGVPVGNLAALGRMVLPDDLPPADRSVEGIADLIWEARRLTFDQVREAYKKADSMRRS